MIRTVLAATNSANTTSTMTTISAATAAPSLFAHERSRAPDLDHLHAPAGLDDIVLVVGARGPHLAVDLHHADALVVGDALEHDARTPDQRSRPGAQLGGLVQVPARDR